MHRELNASNYTYTLNVEQAQKVLKSDSAWNRYLLRSDAETFVFYFPLNAVFFQRIVEFETLVHGNKIRIEQDES